MAKARKKAAGSKERRFLDSLLISSELTYVAFGGTPWSCALSCYELSEGVWGGEKVNCGFLIRPSLFFSVCVSNVHLPAPVVPTPYTRYTTRHYQHRMFVCMILEF